MLSTLTPEGVQTVKNNPARFDEPYEFEITFECLEQLQKGKCARICISATVTNKFQTSSGS